MYPPHRIKLPLEHREEVPSGPNRSNRCWLSMSALGHKQILCDAGAEADMPLTWGRYHYSAACCVSRSWLSFSRDRPQVIIHADNRSIEREITGVVNSVSA